MWHPNPEDLARLVDETPTAVEAEHLAGCAECAAELDAMRAEHGVLATLPRILPVPTSWDAMRHRLDREGILSAGGPRTRWVPAIAAALALFLAGGAAGIAVARTADGGAPVIVASEPAPSSSVESAALNPDDAARRSDELPLDSIPVLERDAPAKLAARTDPAPRERVRQAADDGEQLPSLYGTPAVDPGWNVLTARASRASTPDEAARFVRDAEGAYLAAMTRLAELTENQSTDPAVRLATLNGIVVTTGAALERSPADPVINGYHLAARAQRDALLRTVSSTPARDPWY